MDATTVAVDLAKTVFELAMANAQWRVVARRRLNRAQFTRFLTQTSPTHVVMEACGMAHYWGRLAQQHGHRVTLLPPAYVRPYVRRNKTDRADAEAILEAVRSGEMPSVPVKRIEQQALVALHRVREQWMTTRTARINTLRGILREHGLLLPAGARAALQAVPTILDDAETALPMHLRTASPAFTRRSGRLKSAWPMLERELRALADGRSGGHPAARDPRHRAVDGHGAGGHRRAHSRVSPRAPVCQLARTDAPRAFQRRSATARGISKHGDVYLRCLLTHGARAVLLMAHRRAASGQSLARLHHWAVTLRARRGPQQSHDRGRE